MDRPVGKPAGLFHRFICQCKCPRNIADFPHRLGYILVLRNSGKTGPVTGIAPRWRLFRNALNYLVGVGKEPTHCASRGVGTLQPYAFFNVLVQ